MPGKKKRALGWARCDVALGPKRDRVCGSLSTHRESRLCGRHSTAAVQRLIGLLEDADKASAETISATVTIPTELPGELLTTAEDFESSLVLGVWVARQAPQLLEAITTPETEPN